MPATRDIQTFVPTHVVLDAARMGAQFSKAAEHVPNHACLYGGESAKNLSSVAPYLFSLAGKKGFLRWLLKEGSGLSWGIYFRSSSPMDRLRLHLKKFLMVRMEDGRQMYFRFYDPRVLSAVLPTFLPGELNSFFGPVEEFAAEQKTGGEMRSYSLTQGKLVQRDENAHFWG